ncbi:YvrJ family protein [Romboutsia sp.]|uniref:YvrJ family protein n=1 Tax=Romboutsia sp. TaxID=1965302 RepID=UPI003F41AE1D
MTEISNLISNIGFPIVACIFMYIQQQELNKTISELSSTLKTIDNRIDNLEGRRVS